MLRSWRRECLLAREASREHASGWRWLVRGGGGAISPVELLQQQPIPWLDATIPEVPGRGGGSWR